MKNEIVNLKNIIDRIVKEESNLSILMSDISLKLDLDSNDKDSVIISDVIDLLKKYPANTRVIELFASILHLIDDEEILKQYDIGDIEKLLLLNTKSKRLDLDAYEEIINFYWAVMDDKEKAMDYLNEVIQRSETKLSEFKNLVNEIESY